MPCSCTSHGTYVSVRARQNQTTTFRQGASSIGLQPDVLICRSEHSISEDNRRKIALFTNVEERAVIMCEDADSIYQIPRALYQQDLDDLICERFGLDLPEADLSDWDMVVDRLLNAEEEVTIGLVGKYVELPDAYKSINEALLHAGITHKTKVNIEYVDAEKLETDNNLLANLKSLDGILVPGGFGERERWKMQAITYARENDAISDICLGMQLSVIEYAMNVLKIDANSTEFDRNGGANYWSDY